MPTFPGLTGRPDFRTDPFVAPALTNALRYGKTFASMSPAGSTAAPTTGLQANSAQPMDAQTNPAASQATASQRAMRSAIGGAAPPGGF